MRATGGVPATSRRELPTRRGETEKCAQKSGLTAYIDVDIMHGARSAGVRGRRRAVDHVPMLRTAASVLRMCRVAAMIALVVPLGTGIRPEDAELLRWAAEADGYNSSVTISTELEEGRGLVLTSSLPASRVALWIPKAKALDLESCGMSSMQRAALQPAGPYPLNQYVNLSLALLFERELGSRSRFAPYLQSLPPPDLPPPNMFSWSQAQLDLALSTGVDDVFGQETRPANESDDGMITESTRCPAEVSKALDQLVAKLRGRFAVGVGSTQWASGTTAKMRKWACAIAFSRNFGGSLYPVADMANHKFRAHQEDDLLAIAFDPTCLDHLHARDNKRMQACAKATVGAGRGFLTTRVWAAGEQLYDFYGWFGKVYMLLVYGFADSDGNGHACSKLVLPLPAVEYTHMETVLARMVDKCKVCSQGGDACGKGLPRACAVATHCAQYIHTNLRWSQVNKKQHQTQRLNSLEPTGVPETLSDCMRIPRLFTSAEQVRPCPIVST